MRTQKGDIEPKVLGHFFIDSEFFSYRFNGNLRNKGS
jgi:hypothetical protein